MLDVYAGNNGSKIPFYYKAERYEGDPLKAYPKKGESSESNHFGEYGELKSYFDGTDKAHSVEQVVDPTNHGGAINEYDFGKGTPNIKSMWNTLDFEIGGSPFAYIPTKKINMIIRILVLFNLPDLAVPPIVRTFAEKQNIV